MSDNNNLGWRTGTHYLCYVDKNGRNVAEIFEDEEAAVKRSDELGLDWDSTYYIFSTEDGETRPLPIGTFNTECYFVIHADGNNLAWTAFISQEAALGKTSPAHPFIFNYDADISGNGSDVHPI